MNPRLPGIHDHLAIVGRTGTGKTHFGLWHLSKMDFTVIPTVILDFKQDDFWEIRATQIGYTVPSKPGLYVLRPRLDEKEKLKKFLWDVWEKGNVRIFCDEGYMIEYMNCSEPYVAILTQGRSKCIPTITLSQRPVFVSRFVFSEAAFIQVFELSDVRDYDTVTNFCPDECRIQLPFRHSWYYDSARKQLVQFSPASDREAIISAINSKLKTRRI